MRLFDQPFDFQILANPIFWTIGPAEAWAVAVPGGGRREGESDHFTEVHAIDAHGHELRGFPVLRGAPYRVAPSNQLAAVDLDGDGKDELLVIDLEGRLRGLRPSGEQLAASAPAPERALSVWPPTLVRSTTGRTALLVQSHEMQPRAASRNAIHFMTLGGAPYPGYPAATEGWPAEHPPVIDSTIGVVYVLLRGGDVDAFALRDGARPAGFPLHSEPLSDPEVRLRLVLQGSTPWLATGAPYLMRIHGGQARKVEVPGAGALTGLAVLDGVLYAVDEAKGKLQRIADDGTATRVTDLVPGERNLDLQVLNSNGGRVFVVLSAARADPDRNLDRLFEERAPDDLKQDLNTFVLDSYRELFHTDQPSPEQRAQFHENIVDVKRSFLVRALKPHELETYLGTDQSVHLLVLIEDQRGTQVLLDERLAGFFSETSLGACPYTLPAVRVSPSGILVALGVNAVEEGAGRSRLMVFQVPAH